ncbi:MAG: Asp/Glu/Hydantoin racemase family protein [Gammaproteobacteria bacterium]|nr:Asp/Glu/Hydantoin racemase family protein [Gammaproteobacteria bacterium]
MQPTYPMAGISLLRQTIRLFQCHGAWKDADFPEIHLINFPFSEMLSKQFDQEKLSAELLQCFRSLRYCEHIVIACNTLHLFLPEGQIPYLVNLIKLIKSKIPIGARPLVLASHTSASENLHGRLLGMDCEYWEPKKSQKLIDEILQGKQIELDWLLDLAKRRVVILGCTEYSLALEHLPNIQGLIDPIKLAAQTLFELYNHDTSP